VSGITTTVNRRREETIDRRKHSRSGRRSQDPNPRASWRRLGWLFAAYALYLSVRSLPATITRFFKKSPTP
jgi:hypothetical protein